MDMSAKTVLADASIFQIDFNFYYSKKTMSKKKTPTMQ